MKVTAIIPDNLVEEVKHIAKARNITESIIKALKEWTEMQRLRALNAKVGRKPLVFKKNYSAGGIRRINRKLPR